MRHIFGLGISILSIILGVGVVVGYCIAYGVAKWSIESATWILFVLGAPTTLLNFILEKAGFYTSGLLKGVWNCIPIWFFYLLQYQLIALLIYKGIINLTSKSGIIYLIIVIVTILISAKIMWNIIMGYWV